MFYQDFGPPNQPRPQVFCPPCPPPPLAGLGFNPWVKTDFQSIFLTRSVLRPCLFGGVVFLYILLNLLTISVLLRNLPTISSRFIEKYRVFRLAFTDVVNESEEGCRPSFLSPPPHNPLFSRSMRSCYSQVVNELIVFSAASCCLKQEYLEILYVLEVLFR